MRCEQGPYFRKHAGYPANPKTIGEAIRKRRLDLKRIVRAAPEALMKVPTNSVRLPAWALMDGVFMAEPRRPPRGESIRLHRLILHHVFERPSIDAKDGGTLFSCYRPAPFAENGRVIDIPPPPDPPFDIETFEPIEPPWQAIREWIPDDDGDPVFDLFDQRTDARQPALIPCEDGCILILDLD